VLELISFGIIYKATNKNGKYYIGQTIQGLSKRVYQHLYDASIHRKYNSAFHNALRKYGEEAFEWEVIEECYSKEELDEMEYHYIIQYNSFNRENGYNLSLGGEGNHGFKHSSETKQKISDSNKGKTLGRKHTEESKRKMSAIMKGRKYSDSHCKAISEANKGKKLSYEHKAKLSISHKGKKLSEEHCKKISDSNKGKLLGRKFSEEHKRKLSEAHIGKTFSEETRKKLSSARYGKYRGESSACAKKYLIITPENTMFVVNGLNAFCKLYTKCKLNTGALVAVAKGSRPHHKHHKCEYYDSIKHTSIKEWTNDS